MSANEYGWEARYRQALLDQPAVSRITLADGQLVAVKDIYVPRTLLHEVVQKQPDRAAGGSVDPGDEDIGFQHGVLQRQPDEPEREITVKLPVDLWPKLQDERVVLVEGPAGMGKSTLTKQLVRESETHYRIPIWIPFRQFVSSGLSILEYLDQHYVPWLGLSDLRVPNRADQTGRTRSLGQWCYDQWQSGLGVLILDGLDEVFRHEERVAALKALPITGTDRTRPATILTSRPLSQSLLLQMARVEVQGLQPSAQREFIKRYRSSLQLTDEQITRFTSATQKQSRLQSLLTRPGHLIQILTTYAKTNTLLDTETAVLNSLLESRLTITGRTQPPVEGDDAKKKRQVLESLALHLLACRQGQQHTRAQLLTLIQQVLWEHATHHTPLFPLAQATALLNDLTRNSGLLREVEPELYEFETVIWLQHLTGSALANEQTIAPLQLTESKVLDFFDRKAWDPEWEPVLMSWVGNAAHPFPLFSRLMDKQLDDLARHRLGVAGRCLAEIQAGLQQHPHYQILAERIPTESFTVWKASLRRDAGEDVIRSLGKAWIETEVGQTLLLAFLLPGPHMVDPDRSVCQAAVGVLGGLGRAMPVAVQQVFLSRLADREQGVSLHARLSLNRLGSAIPVGMQEALVARLADPDRYVSGGALLALIGLGVAMPAPAQQALVAELANSDRFFRAFAMSQRPMQAMPVAVQQALVARLEDPNKAVRNAATRALRMLGAAMPSAVQQAPVARLVDTNSVERTAPAKALSSAQQQGLRLFVQGSVLREGRLVSKLSATAPFSDSCYQGFLHTPATSTLPAFSRLPLTAL